MGKKEVVNIISLAKSYVVYAVKNIGIKIDTVELHGTVLPT